MPAWADSTGLKTLLWFGQAHLYSMWYHRFFYASGIFLGKLEKYHIRFLTLQLVGLLTHLHNIPDYTL